MTDLEITKLCAVAMGFDRLDEKDFLNRPIMLAVKIHSDGAEAKFTFDPLHDDAQAIALVKKFRLQIWTETAYWLVADPDSTERWRAMNTDLNRAICEAVAKMQKAKT